MTTRIALALLMLTTALPAVAEDAPTVPREILPLDAVRAGQRGYGLSVFEGSRPERFEVEVLGVLRNQGPQQSYILARLSGRNLEATGVIAGMSGSPVYLDGRLAGAVAFAWPFANEPIAGITPIESMMPLVESPLGLPAPTPVTPPIDLAWLHTPPTDTAPLVAALERLRLDSADGRRSGIEWSGWGFSGASRLVLEQGLGLLAPAGAAGSVADSFDLEPGSAVSGLLIDGDLRLAATGTVTDRFSDGRILAFGHPFLGLGPMRLPMAGAEIVAVVDSQVTSFKIANIGEVIGAFDLDRRPGLRGRVGLEAVTFPLEVLVRGDREVKYDLRVSHIPTLTPSLVALSALASLDATTQATGSHGLDLEIFLEFTGQPEVRMKQSFDGPQAAVEAAMYVFAVSSFLEQNPWTELGMETVRLNLVQHQAPRMARLIGAYASRTRVRPGDTVQITVDLQAWRGEILRRNVEITVPRGLPAGRYHLLVGDGPSIDAARLSAERAAPVRIEQALRLLRDLHSRRELVVLGVFSDRGLSVAGEPMPQLPGSLQSVWAAAASGSALPLNLAIAQKLVVPLDVPMFGASRLTLEVQRRQPLGSDPQVDPSAESEPPVGEDPMPGPAPESPDEVPQEPPDPEPSPEGAR